MYCPRAMSVVFGVGVCALVVGCGSIQMPAEDLSRSDHLPPTETMALAVATPAPTVVEITRPVSREEVIGWSIRGITDDVILDRLAHSSTAFSLTASEEIHLRDAGVSDEVVRAMRSTAE